MVSLARMGLKDPSVKGYPDYDKDLRTWQLWYEQVKAGKRTFSFVGIDRVHNLSGPVEVSMKPVSSRPVGSRSGSSGPLVDAKAVEAEPKSYLWLALHSVVIVVVWMTWRKLWPGKQQ